MNDDCLTYRLLAGIFRHNEHCRPGLYSVVLCLGEWVHDTCTHAVCDDFGNLVRVA